MQVPEYTSLAMRTFVLAALMLSPGGAALAAAPHVHGAAFLDVAVDGGEVSLSLRGAGEGFVGFEHAPANEAERRRAKAAADALRDGKALFAFSPAAACSQRSATVGLPAAGEAHDDHGHGHHEHHADWSAQWSFRCRVPAALRELRAHLFDAFPGVTELRVQFVSATFQTGATLTARSRTLILVPSP